MRDIDQERARELLAPLGITQDTTVSVGWLEGGIRHLVRNVDTDSFHTYDPKDTDWTPGKYNGGDIAKILQELADLAFPGEGNGS